LPYDGSDNTQCFIPYGLHQESAVLPPHGQEECAKDMIFGSMDFSYVGSYSNAYSLNEWIEETMPAGLWAHIGLGADDDHDGSYSYEYHGFQPDSCAGPCVADFDCDILVTPQQFGGFEFSCDSPVFQSEECDCSGCQSFEKMCPAFEKVSSAAPPARRTPPHSLTSPSPKEPEPPCGPNFIRKCKTRPDFMKVSSR